MSSRFEAELKKIIDTEVERCRQVLESGVAIKDYAQYQNYIGRITALNAVVKDYYGEVQTKLNKE